jgi:hypothetical protein
MKFPNYSDILEKISSEILDKSSKFTIEFYPTVKINLSQELFTFIMRLNSLNLAFRDDLR